MLEMNNELYSLSSGFRACCTDAVSRLIAEVSDSIRLCEIITLPDYSGKVVLRLDLKIHSLGAQTIIHSDGCVKELVSNLIEKGRRLSLSFRLFNIEQSKS